MASHSAGAFSNVSSQNGGTARPGVARIVKPGASLATTRGAGGRRGEDQEMRRRLSAFDERHFSSTACRHSWRHARRPDRHRTRRAPAQWSRCPGEPLRAGRARSSMAAPQARGWPRPRRAAVPDRRRAPAPRTRAGSRAIRPRRRWSRATQDPAEPSQATASPSPGRWRNSPRPCRPARCSRENPAPTCGAGCVRHPIRRLSCGGAREGMN